MKYLVSLLLLALALSFFSCKKDDKEDPQPAPQGKITISQITDDLTVNFTATTSGAVADSITWNFGDNKTGRSASVSHTYENYGSYAVWAVGHFGGQRDTARLTVELTEATGAAIDLETLHPNVFRFSARPTGNPTAYRWNFGDGKSSEDSTAEHEYSETGSFTATLTLSYRSGATKTATVNVNVTEMTYEVAKISIPLGEMTIWLHPQTPLHRANFLKLCREGFYDSTSFHRVVRGFVNQGGDPLSRNDPNGAGGSGGPGYVIPAEIRSELRHIQGAVAAARTADSVNPLRNSSGSQFYIAAPKAGTPQLDGQYTVFGQVIDGIDVVEMLNAVQTTVNDRPVQPVRMGAVVQRFTRQQLQDNFGFTP